MAAPAGVRAEAAVDLSGNTLVAIIYNCGLAEREFRNSSGILQL